jgi:hypothetical protein
VSFVSELREELVAAAEREQARRLPRIVLPAGQTLAVAAAAAAVALVVVLVVGGLSSRPSDRTPAGPAPTPEVRPLFGGTLEPRVRYETRAFVPTLSFAVADRKWRTIATDRPDSLLLEYGEGYFDPAGERRPPGGLEFSRMTDVYEPAVPDVGDSLTTAPADLYSWLRAHPDLRVGPAEPVTVAGVPGVRFDVDVRFDRPTHPYPECRRLLQVTCTTLAPEVFLQDGTLMRMTILQIEPDPLIVTLTHFTGTGLRQMEKFSAPVLESLRIG